MALKNMLDQLDLIDIHKDHLSKNSGIEQNICFEFFMAYSPG